MAVLALMTTSAQSKMTGAAPQDQFHLERLPTYTAYYHREGLKLVGRGPWRTAGCPFHHDRTPSLRINIQKGGFVCHGSGAKGGDVLDFHRRRYSMSSVSAAKDLGALEESVAPARRPENAKEPAKRLAKPTLDEGLNPAALHVYRDAYGRELYWKIRVKHPATKEKWFRPMRFDGRTFVSGEPKFENGKPLYGLQLLASRAREVVLVCEGESCADALQKLGLVAITFGGATSDSAADWKPLAGRDILIWPDLGDAGLRYAGAVADISSKIGCRVETIDTNQLGPSEGEDAVNWLARNTAATSQIIFALPKTSATPFIAAIGSICDENSKPEAAMAEPLSSQVFNATHSALGCPTVHSRQLSMSDPSHRTSGCIVMALRDPARSISGLRVRVASVLFRPYRD